MRKIVLSLLTIVFFILSVPLQKVDAAVTTVWRHEAERGSFTEWYPLDERPNVTVETFDSVVDSERYKIIVWNGFEDLTGDPEDGTVEVWSSTQPFELYHINTGEFTSIGNDPIYKFGLLRSSPNQVVNTHSLGMDGIVSLNDSTRQYNYDVEFEVYEIRERVIRKTANVPVIVPSSNITVNMDGSNRLDSIDVEWTSYKQAKIYLNDVLVKTTDVYSPPVVAASTSITWYEIISHTKINQGSNTVKVEFLKTDDTVTYDYKTFNSSAIEDGGGSGPGKGAPKIPQKPDSANVLDWIMYLVEWIIYPFEVVGWMFSKLFGAIGDVFTSSTGFIKTLSSFFSFLPAEIISVLVVGLIVAVILRIFGR